MTSTDVAAFLAEDAVMERLVLVVRTGAERGTCRTAGCEADHPAGSKYCAPCAVDRRRESQKRWRDNHLATWRARRRETAAA